MFRQSLLILFVLSISDMNGSSISNSRKFRFDYAFSSLADGWLKLHEVPTTWSEARLQCHAEGAVLASPLNENLREAMIELASQEPNPIKTIFTGVHATLTPGYYTSIEGEPLSRLAVRWAPGEPDNADDAERCLAMQPAANGSLSDVRCARPLPYLCYKRKALLVVTGCGTHDPEYTMDQRTGHCYKFHTRSLTWPMAYLTCAAEGGYLAIISSQTESQLIKELYSKYTDSSIIFSKYPSTAAIGFRDWLDGGSWMTIHGQTLNEAGFAVWYNGGPTNTTRPPLHSAALCGAAFRNSGSFIDIACDLPVPFICEKKPESLEEIDDSF